MTQFNNEFETPAPGTCEAFQWEISQAMDEGRELDVSARDHLAACPHCQAFAQPWSEHGQASRMLRQTPPVDATATERIWQAMMLPSDMVAGEAAPRRAPSRPWLRWVALLMLGLLGWGLLDPKTAPAPPEVDQSSGPMLAVSRQAKRLEEPLLREQAAIECAATSGLVRMREIMEWSALALQ